MQGQLDKINDGANWVELFIQQHPYIVAMVVAILASWVVTAAAKPSVSGPWKARGLRLFDCAVAFGICARMWPGDHRFLWALLIGASSPFVYWVTSELVCWKFPKLRRFLTLRELVPEPDPTDDSENLLPPGESK